MEFLIGNLPLVMASVIVPFLLVFLFIVIRGSTANQSSGADVLQAKVTLDFAIAVLPEPWLPLANEVYKTSIPGIFIALGVGTTIFFTVIVRMESRLLKYYAGKYLRAAGQSVPALGQRFPYFSWGVGWFMVLVAIIANVLATLIVIRGVTLK